MSTISKQLKYGTFVWDDERKEFDVYVTNKETGVQKMITLDKTYAFAWQRFLTRISQRNWLRKVKK